MSLDTVRYRDVSAVNLEIPESLSSFSSIELPSDVTVFGDGKICENFYFVQEGSIRVDLVTADGKSILLYRIGPTQTCILSTSCLISSEPYCAQATTESEVKVIAVSKSSFDKLLRESESFRQLVFQSFSSRLSTMMATIDEVSFASLDRRLAKRLLEFQPVDDAISITHEQLASDLGSAREVISRKLLEWDKAGLISRGRGSITINDMPSLQRLTTVSD